MEQLYRKITYPSGRVRYVPSCEWNYSDPADGLWYVKRTKSGKSYKWLVERLEDLPYARTLAELEPHRDVICKAILDVKIRVSEKNGIMTYTAPCANDICDKIFEYLAERT